VRIIIPFAGTGDTQYPYLFHCHILEHEDMGMMGRFYLLDPA
jgi:bilirubin oxidase